MFVQFCQIFVGIMVIAFVGATLMCGTLAGNEVGQLSASSVGTADTETMEEVFARSETVHEQSMTLIMKGMSPTKAMQVLQTIVSMKSCFECSDMGPMDM